MGWKVQPGPTAESNLIELVDLAHSTQDRTINFTAASPIDLIPDFPIIGQIDDIAVLLIALRLFTDMAGPKVMGNASPEPDDQGAPISADYRVRDDTDM